MGTRGGETQETERESLTITRHIAKVLYSVMLQGRGISIISEVKCSNSENLYFNTLGREKVQGKSLGCIKSRGDTYAIRSHCRGMKEPHVARDLRVADPCPMSKTQT